MRVWHAFLLAVLADARITCGLEWNQKEALSSRSGGTVRSAAEGRGPLGVWTPSQPCTPDGAVTTTTLPLNALTEATYCATFCAIAWYLSCITSHAR